MSFDVINHVLQTAQHIYHNEVKYHYRKTESEVGGCIHVCIHEVCTKCQWTKYRRKWQGYSASLAAQNTCVITISTLFILFQGDSFYATSFKAVQVLVSPMASRWVGGLVCGSMDGHRQKVYQGCISLNMRCRKLIRGRGIGWGCRCATSWCDLDLTFYLAVVTLSLKILLGLYLINCKAHGTLVRRIAVRHG